MKNCLMCGETLVGKRKDSRFCGSSCRAKYWELSKKGGLDKISGLSGTNNTIEPFQLQLPETTHNQLEPFKNTIKTDGDTPDSQTQGNTSLKPAEGRENLPLPAQYIDQQVSKPNLSYHMTNMILSQTLRDIDTVKQQILRTQQAIKNEAARDGTWMSVVGSTTGAYVGYSIAQPESELPDIEVSKRQKNKKNNAKKAGNDSFFYALLGGLLGLGIGQISRNITESDREQEKQRNIARLQVELKKLFSILNNLELAKKRYATELSGISPNVLQTIQQLNPAYTQAIQLLEEKKAAAPIAAPEKLQLENNLSGMEVTNDLETGKIKSMKNIANLKFQLLNFSGKWQAFFGQPQTNFFCVVHGMSGEGKTNFAVQFAKYLAENFGNVLFVSGEEGFAPTFQEKIKLLGAERVPRLYGGDFRTGQEVLNEAPNKYHFIVLDSLNNMDIDPELMKAIRQRFKQSGIVAICQSTKDGKIRGSYQIVHDSDMAVKVVNGLACTTKNRFKEKGMEFNVFEVYNKNKKPLTVIKNLPGKYSDQDGLDTDFRNTI